MAMGFVFLVGLVCGRMACGCGRRSCSGGCRSGPLVARFLLGCFGYFRGFNRWGRFVFLFVAFRVFDRFDRCTHLHQPILPRIIFHHLPQRLFRRFTIGRCFECHREHVGVLNRTGVRALVSGSLGQAGHHNHIGGAVGAVVTVAVQCGHAVPPPIKQHIPRSGHNPFEMLVQERFFGQEEHLFLHLSVHEFTGTTPIAGRQLHHTNMGMDTDNVARRVHMAVGLETNGTGDGLVACSCIQHRFQQMHVLDTQQVDTLRAFRIKQDDLWVGRTVVWDKCDAVTGGFG